MLMLLPLILLLPSFLDKGAAHNLFQNSTHIDLTKFQPSTSTARRITSAYGKPRASLLRFAVPTLISSKKGKRNSATAKQDTRKAKFHRGKVLPLTREKSNVRLPKPLINTYNKIGSYTNPIWKPRNFTYHKDSNYIDLPNRKSNSFIDVQIHKSKLKNKDVDGTESNDDETSADGSTDGMEEQNPDVETPTDDEEEIVDKDGDNDAMSLFDAMKISAKEKPAPPERKLVKHVDLPTVRWFPLCCKDSEYPPFYTYNLHIFPPPCCEKENVKLPNCCSYFKEDDIDEDFGNKGIDEFYINTYYA